MRMFMEQTVKHRQDRLNEEAQLQFSETKARQLQKLAMTQTAMKTFQEQLDKHQQVNAVPYVPYFLDVPCYQQQIYRDYVIDYASYLRRVSKYDLDRGTLDFQRLQREKHRDRTENVKIKKKQWERGLAHKKKKEAEEKMQKLVDLEEIRDRQARERKEFVRRQQEQFRRAIEERTNSDKHSQYVGATSSNGGLSNKGR